MKTKTSAIARVVAAFLAAFLGVSAQAEAYDSDKSFIGIGFTVGYSFDGDDGHHAIFGPMLTLNRMPIKSEDFGVGGTFRALYTVGGGWMLSVGAQAGFYWVEAQPKLEFGFGYHMPYYERPGGIGLHMGFSVPIAGGIIDMGPSVRTFQPLSKGPLSEWAFGGDIWFPSMAIYECVGCG